MPKSTNRVILIYSTAISWRKENLLLLKTTSKHALLDCTSISEKKRSYFGSRKGISVLKWVLSKPLFIRLAKKTFWKWWMIYSLIYWKLLKYIAKWMCSLESNRSIKLKTPFYWWRIRNTRRTSILLNRSIRSIRIWTNRIPIPIIQMMCTRYCRDLSIGINLNRTSQTTISERMSKSARHLILWNRNYINKISRPNSLIILKSITKCSWILRLGKWLNKTSSKNRRKWWAIIQ